MSVAIWVGYPRSYTAGRARAPQFVTLHYTAGSEGPSSAEAGADYDKRRTDGTSTHYFTDSLGPALQEVPDGDRAHAALYHGNEIGIHIEICGTVQTREQWLDSVSYATLVTTAALTREICANHGFALRRLSVAETRAAYYNAPGSRPTGITDHNACTLAFPEDGGSHTDVGTAFPWDVFMALVTSGPNPSPGPLPPFPGGDDMPKIFRVDQGGLTGITDGPTWYHLPSPDAVSAACRVWGIREGLDRDGGGIIAINENDLAGMGTQVPWPGGGDTSDVPDHTHVGGPVDQ